ncbi:MAG: hypothetical protein AABX29_09745 [Nanoarchaeota archaeon]
MGIFSEDNKREHNKKFGEGREQGRKGDFLDDCIEELGDIIGTVVPTCSKEQSRREGYKQGETERYKNKPSEEHKPSRESSDSGGYDGSGGGGSYAGASKGEEVAAIGCGIVLLLGVVLGIGSCVVGSIKEKSKNEFSSLYPYTYNSPTDYKDYKYGIKKNR